MLGDVIEISPSPELEPRAVYRPLRRKREPLSHPDGNESAIELTDSTDNQSSSPCKKVKRRKAGVKSSAGPSTSRDIPVTQTRALSPRIGRRTPKSIGQANTSRQASAVPRRTPSPGQIQPHDYPTPVLGHGQEPGAVQVRGRTPLAMPDSPQVPDHRLTPPLEHIPLGEELPPPVTADEVVQESHERLVERVREVVPDVLPAHVFELLSIHENTFANNLDAIIHILLEDRSYPKDVKGKGKAVDKKTEEVSGNIDTDVDYTLLDTNRRLGSTYRTLSLQSLRSSFANIDHTYVEEIFTLHDAHYSPTYLYLLDQGATPSTVVPVAPNLRKRKGKANSRSALDEKEFMKEHAWLVQKLNNRHSLPIPATTSQDVKDVEEEGGDIECGCCFSSYSFSTMAQCTDTHLFCKSCVTSYASAKLGEQDSDLCCMDISGCKMAFPDSELRRVLPEKLFELYEQIRQQRDIELAEIEGLEECPFCDFKAVIDVDFEADKLLRCQNEECAKFSCRKCKKEDHLPKSCEEMEEDKKLDGKHAIEEAMTRALMRNCPKCRKGFIKEYGCNKMTCTYCHTVSCYVCRSIITGYEHFDQSRPGDARRVGSSSKKCPLWDTVEDRHAKEVIVAAETALEEYKALHPDVRDEDIRVELPPPPQPNMRAQHAPGRGPRLPPLPAHVQVHHVRNAHVPIAHPVVALPLPALPAPPFNPEHLFVRHPPYFGQLRQPPAPRRGAPVMFQMPIPPQYNALQAPVPPQPYNPLQAPQPQPYNPLQALLPVPMPQPPRFPPLQQMLPPVQVAAGLGPRRVAVRGKRRR